MSGQAATPFQSPPSLQVTVQVPHRGPVTGMGLPRGIVLIVGGGYHGKSTLLEALQAGVYDKVRSVFAVHTAAGLKGCSA